MRKIFTIAIAGFGISLGVVPFDVGAAFAEEISGAEFRKLVIGNTLQQKFHSQRRGQEMEFMYHFIDDKKLLFSSGQSAPTQTQDWSVTERGRFCYVHTYRSTREICWDLIRFDGKAITGKSGRGREVKFFLLKGKRTAG